MRSPRTATLAGYNSPVYTLSSVAPRTYRPACAWPRATAISARRIGGVIRADYATGRSRRQRSARTQRQPCSWSHQQDGPTRPPRCRRPDPIEWAPVGVGGRSLDPRHTGSGRDFSRQSARAGAEGRRRAIAQFPHPPHRSSGKRPVRLRSRGECRGPRTSRRHWIGCFVGRTRGNTHGRSAPSMAAARCRPARPLRGRRTSPPITA